MARNLPNFFRRPAVDSDVSESPLPESPKGNSKPPPSDYGFYTINPNEFKRFKISKDLVPDLEKLIERFFPKTHWKEISESKQQSGSFNQIHKFETKDNKIKRALRISKKPCFVEWPSGEIVDYDSYLYYRPESADEAKEDEAKEVSSRFDGSHIVFYPTEEEEDASSRPLDIVVGAAVAMKNKDNMIQQYEQSLYNWAKASERDICPKIQYWGFIKKRRGSSNITFIYQCIISELYPMDLNQYMGSFQIYPSWSYPDASPRPYAASWEDGGELSNKEVKIQKTLTFLLDKLARFPFYMICFDIKPSNCVINPALLESQDENVWKQSIKLIDLDADYCNPFDFLKSKELDGHMRKVTSTLQNMMMANYFYTFYQRNIFADYFKNEIADFMKENKSSLEVLFCKKASSRDILYASGIRNNHGDPNLPSERLGPIQVATNEREQDGNPNTLFRKTRKAASAAFGLRGVVNPKRYQPTTIPEEAADASRTYYRLTTNYLFPAGMGRHWNSLHYLSCKQLFKILYERCFILTPERGKNVYNSETRGGKKQKKTISKRRNINNIKRKSKKLRKLKKFKKSKKN